MTREERLLSNPLQDVADVSNLTTQELLKKVNDIIETAKKAGQEVVVLQEIERSSTTSVHYSRYVRAVTFFLLGGRALSCTFRYVVTRDALQFLLSEPFIKQNNQQWASIFTVTGAASFCVTDAILTIISSKDSVAELCRIRSAVKKNLNLLRDENGNLPIFLLIILLALMPGGMLGAWFRGEVGVLGVTRQITALFTDQPSHIREIIFKVLAYIVGVCSAICYCAFQAQQALTQIRIKRALKKDPYAMEYYRRNRKDIFLNLFVTFLISCAMALINMMAAFYDKGDFNFEWGTFAKALFVGMSGLTLCTFFTVAPNFLHKTMQAKYKKTQSQDDTQQNNHHIGIFLIKCFGVISSTGNSLAVFPAIVHTLLQISQKENLTDENKGYIIAGIGLTLILAVPMFVRDYAYYAKLVLELLFGRAKTPSAVAVQSTQEKGCWARLTSYLKKPRDTSIQYNHYLSANNLA
ncbi:MAG: hypothetical protein A3E81_02050 [Gammaproteobacteria bacterium RIFCSPHIGHO2_12_FULL_36_30]|nr:MAG: hypothetical protein A3E81_02050 [Gammaproteobacteria bacterium RIFCSPHIGHO2_12_FULL_36_30]